MNTEDIKKIVRSGYAKVALQNIPCCGISNTCYGGAGSAEEIST